jgi:hypothetical protein
MNDPFTKSITEIIECNHQPKYRRLKLDKVGDGVDVCLYHIPGLEDKVICKYRGDKTIARAYRPDGSYDLIEYYECLRNGD